MSGAGDGGPLGGEEQLQELADNTPALMWMTDEEGRVTFVNRGWLRFTGRTLEDEQGDTWASSAHPDDRGELRRRWLEALKGRRRFQMEYRLRTAEGPHRWVADVGMPRHQDGNFVGYVGTATDIHERGRVALIVGDVVGHGTRAAAVMGQLRNAFRAYALIDGSPQETVSRLNRLVLASGEDVMATARRRVDLGGAPSAAGAGRDPPASSRRTARCRSGPPSAPCSGSPTGRSPAAPRCCCTPTASRSSRCASSPSRRAT